MRNRIFLLCFAFALLFGCAPKESPKEQGAYIEQDAASDGEIQEQDCLVKVTFFDVGKGDAILIETSGHRVMIDAGYDDTSEIILSYFKDNGIEKLDYLLITHFDKDHVGGADHILREVETKNVLQPDYESDSEQYQEYIMSMEEQDIIPNKITETMNLSLDGIDFLVYPPQKTDYKEKDNDFSLVVSMTCGEKRFLFTGDCEKERLTELLTQKEFDLTHDVLKIPHHGRKEKNSGEFLKAVSPEAAVITSSDDKPADDEIRKMLKKLGTEVYFTNDGTVTCLCDGVRVSVKT
ncbi:MAG: MBL fold metallo-hydrolase [Lachnospiraceae bacterium]|nr:MBL fold metallo-hydrolase [Lachnospiraceae bacterium]